jgi:hypothetical protein
MKLYCVRTKQKWAYVWLTEQIPKGVYSKEHFTSSEILLTSRFRGLIFHYYIYQRVGLPTSSMAQYG